MIFQPNLILNVVEPTAARPRPQYRNPVPLTTHLIGPLKYPLTTSGISSVFLAHYASDDQPFSGPVKKLTFTQLGSRETPNLSPYTSTCEAVEFSGYIDTPLTIFDVVHQLPKVSKVDIVIGSAEQHAFKSQHYPKHFPKTPLCARVKSLKIVMDLEYFHSFEHDCNGDVSQCRNPGNCSYRIQDYLVGFVESLIKFAGDSFPNLKSLVVDLPENERLCNAVQSLIKVCHGLRKKTQATLQSVVPNADNAEVYSADYSELHDSCSWFVPNRSSTTNTTLPVNLPKHFSSSYYINKGYSECPSSEEDTISPSSDFYPSILPHNGISVFGHRPPPGFAPKHDATTPERFVLDSCAATSSFHKNDVEQRVNSWLSNIGN